MFTSVDRPHFCVCIKLDSVDRNIAWGNSKGTSGRAQDVEIA